MKFTDLKTKLDTAKAEQAPELRAAVQKVRADYAAKCDAVEAEMWADMGIKPEDLYPPEERAARFDALLKACCNTPPMPMTKVKEKTKERREAKKKA